MTPETLHALKASIKHWEENVAAEQPEDAGIDVADCALCGQFYALDCIGCPVYQKTNKECCYGTPYGAASAAHDRWFATPSHQHREQWRAAAQEELDFLKSLLPQRLDAQDKRGERK